MKLNKKTKTSSFGVSSRVSHDSSKFYASRLYEEFEEQSPPDEYQENFPDKKILNQIYCKSSERMNELPDNSVHLMVTSPPYNVGKEYDADMSLSEYLRLLDSVLREVYRWCWSGEVEPV